MTRNLMQPALRNARSAAILAVALGVAVSAAGDRQVVAEVGPTQISLDQFRLVLHAMRGVPNSSGALQTVTPSGRQQIVDALIDSALFAQGARDEGLDKQPEVRFWIDQAVSGVLAKKYVELKAAAAPSGDEALRQFYETHRGEFVTAERVRARHILVKTREEAQQVLSDLRAGRDFSQLARAKSIDTTTRDNGGELGWVTHGVMVKPFEDALFALRKGELSGVVQTTFGFHVIEAEDVSAPSVPAFDAIKPLVRGKAVQAAIDAAKADLARRYPVKVDRELVAAMTR